MSTGLTRPSSQASLNIGIATVSSGWCSIKRLAGWWKAATAVLPRSRVPLSVTLRGLGRPMFILKMISTPQFDGTPPRADSCVRHILGNCSIHGNLG